MELKDERRKNIFTIFSVEENKLKYLNKYTICNLPEEEDIKQMIFENYGVIIKKKRKH